MTSAALNRRPNMRQQGCLVFYRPRPAPSPHSLSLEEQQFIDFLVEQAVRPWS